MTAPQTCPRCGTSRSPKATGGLCPVCLLRQSLAVFESPEPEPRAADVAALEAAGFTPLRSAIPSERFGDYRLENEVGRGGMGIIYRAHQISLNRKVALKMIVAGPLSSADFAKRLRVEAEVTAALDHPNIVAIHEVGEHQGQPFFTMRLVEGLNLAQALKAGSFEPRRAATVMITVARAVQHAHERGVLHRDLKPSNILLDPQGEPHVTDFGLAKIVHADSTLTLSQAALGTPSYMAPEQASGGSRQVTIAADVYSLGAVLYELLTGRPLFEAETPVQAIQQILEREPERPSRINPRIDRDLETICLKCLNKEPKRRYVSAAALADDLERWLGAKPIQARPVGWIEQGWLWCRRKPGLAALTALVAIFAGVVVVGTPIMLLRLAREQRKAERNLYAASLNLAQDSWLQNDVAHVRQMLQETASYPERGFEWYYWQRQTHLERISFRQADLVSSVAFFPDGRRVVTCGLRSVHVWDPASGEELWNVGWPAHTTSMAVSPDGEKIVVTSSLDGIARILDATTGRELLELRGHSLGIFPVSFSPEGRRIATGSADGTARIWETTSGKECVQFGGEDGHKGWVMAVAFSPDSQRLLTGSWDKTAKVWDAATGSLLLNLEGHRDAIRDAAFSPDGKLIVTAGEDATAKVWAAITGSLLRTFEGHSEGIRSLAIFPDSRRIVTGGYDKEARVWELETGRELFSLRGHTARISSVAISQDGQWILTGSLDMTAKIWSAADGGQLPPLRGHTAEILATAISPDGRWIATGSRDRTARLWEADGGKEMLTLEGHLGEIKSLNFSLDGRRIVTGSWDGTVRIWDVTTGKERLQLKGHEGGIRCVAVSPDGRWIVTSSDDRAVMVWDAASGNQVLTLRGHDDVVNSVAFSPDGHRIVTGSGDLSARVWDATTGKEVLVLRGHLDPINSVAFSPNGRWVLTGSGDACADQIVYLGTGDLTARMWDAISGEQLLILPGHNAAINSVVFSPDGQRILTGSLDGTARLWDVVSGKELLTLRGHSSAVTSVAFSSDGQRVVTGSWDQTARVWVAATPKQVTAWMSQDALMTGIADRGPAQQKARAARAQDPGAIKEWLVLAPVPLHGEDACTAWAEDQIPQERQLHPRAGERQTVGEVELVWSAVRRADPLIDFSEILNFFVRSRASAAYAVCYIHAEAAQSDLVLRVASADTARVYLNEREVYRWKLGSARPPKQDIVRGVALNAGLNVMVFKVLVEKGPTWEGSVCLTDAAGQPVKGVRVSLDPDHVGGP